MPGADFATTPCGCAGNPIAGWLATSAGFTITLVTLSLLASAGLIAALRMWPRHDPEELTHLHETITVDDAQRAGAVRAGERFYLHTHPFVIDADHPRWPARTARQPVLVGADR